MSSSRPAFICASCARTLRQSSKSATSSSSIRAISSETAKVADGRVAALERRNELPRWKQTPPAMKMAFRVRQMPDQPAWQTNDDQEVLDKAMDTVIGDALGRGVRGRDVLDEEVKVYGLDGDVEETQVLTNLMQWLSVTHKSYEQGTQGFNDRLAFLGKRILDLQASKALLEAPVVVPHSAEDRLERHDRLGPLQRHPALDRVDNITTYARHTVLAPNRLSGLAQHYGVEAAVRWKPKHVEKLGWSGIEGVMAHTLCAIIGAIALTKGGQAANEVARQRIIQPLGIRARAGL